MKPNRKARRAGGLRIVTPADALTTAPLQTRFKLLLAWDIGVGDVAISAGFFDREAKTTHEEPYSINRAKLVDLVPSMRLSLIVQAFALLTKKALPDDWNEEHIAHATNCAATLLAVLDTKVRVARFEWSEA